MNLNFDWEHFLIKFHPKKEQSLDSIQKPNLRIQLNYFFLYFLASFSCCIIAQSRKIKCKIVENCRPIISVWLFPSLRMHNLFLKFCSPAFCLIKWKLFIINFCIQENCLRATSVTSTLKVPLSSFLVCGKFSLQPRINSALSFFKRYKWLLCYVQKFTSRKITRQNCF